MEAQGGKAGQPLDAGKLSDVTFPELPLRVEVCPEALSADLRQEALERRRVGVDRSLHVGVEQRAAGWQHMVGVDRGPLRLGVSSQDGRDEIDLGLQVVRHEPRYHPLQGKKMKLGAVDRNGAVLRVSDNVREEHRAPAADPTARMDRCRQPGRRLLDPVWAEEATLPGLPGEGLQIKGGGPQQRDALDDSAGVPGQWVPANLDLGSRRLEVVSGMKDLAAEHLASKLNRHPPIIWFASPPGRAGRGS